MRTLLNSLVLLGLLGVSVPGYAARSASGAASENNTPADKTAIVDVIRQQLDAFQHDDGDAAFSLATPHVQSIYGSAYEFIRMVQTKYKPIYRPGYITFLALRMVNNVPTQDVWLVGADGTPLTARYQMQRQPDGSWRIEGCQLVEDGGRNA